MNAQHVFVPPAGRVEAIVTGPPAGAHVTLRTLCVNKGPAGGVNQASILADIVPASPSDQAMQAVPVSSQPPVYKSDAGVSVAEAKPPQFVVHFTEGNHRYYINGKVFSPNAKPMVTVHIGTYEHWRVTNDTHEVHPFHIHQLHFLTFAQGGHSVPHPVWLDTMNVPQQSTIDIVMDFTDPVIRGVSVFYCHILTHEDKGMMAKILFR
jgi:FtsP/CotA-like multicopper oxidase with cupredoxin domain